MGQQVFGFRKAVKHDAKLRLALWGPSGSGKTYTLLKLAAELGAPVAVVDTERGSASKYADIFQFDVMELGSYDPLNLVEIIDAAAGSGYQVLCIDSLSHFWMGKDGELDQVDRIARRNQSSNSFVAWKQVTPLHNRLIDKIIGAPIHILISLRSKTEWILERDERTGKTAPRKVGLAPVMRDGIEYEFDVCGEMDQQNTLVVSKSRCPKLTGAVILKPGREVAEILKEWLNGAPAPPNIEEVTPAPTPTRDDDSYIGCSGLTGSAGANGSIPPELSAIWKRMCSPSGVVAEFTKLRQELIQAAGTDGESRYQEVLNRHNVQSASQFKSRQPARLCAKELFWAIRNFRRTQNSGMDAGAGDVPAVSVGHVAEVEASRGQQHAD